MIEAIAISGQPDAAKRSCYDCQHCKAAVSWWCTNDNAVKERKTKIPGTEGCKYWNPIRSINDLTFWEKLISDYVRIELS